MEQQANPEAPLPPFAKWLIAIGERMGERQGKLEGERQGELKGELKGKRDTLLRLCGRIGIALSEGDRARIQACDDAATLDRWVDNILGAKTSTDVFS